jgi:hypothetical protein
MQPLDTAFEQNFMQMQAKIKQLNPLVNKKRFAVNEGITDEEFLVADEHHRRQQMMKRNVP